MAESKLQNLNVLFIGNSYTNYNTMTKCFVHICEEQGISVNMTKVAYGSQYLYDYINGQRGDYYYKVNEAVKAKKFDVVFLQEQSTYPVKNPEDFFNSPLLDNQFRTALSEEDYLRNKMYFSQPNIKEEEFEDISQSFNDVYNINNEACFEGADNQINSQKAELNISFDFDLFYRKLREFQISKAVITAELKSLIPSLALAHKIAAVDMASLIHRALDNTGKVSVNKLKEFPLLY